MQLTNKDREQLLNILLQTRRLTKIASSVNAITYSEQARRPQTSHKNLQKRQYETSFNNIV